MDNTVSINLKDKTFDLEIRGLSLNHIKDLSAIREFVAENLKASLVLNGVESGKAAESVSLLLRGIHDIEYILRAVFQG